MNLCHCLPEEDQVNGLSSSSDCRKYEELVQLETLITPDDNDKNTNRAILYGVTGDTNGTPVLFFPPLSATRRMLLILHEYAVQYSLKMICVNRPGTEAPSASLSSSTTKRGMTSSYHTIVQKYMERACLDVVAVLDYLEISKVSILCMCAGAPFSLAFCSKFPDRTSGTFLALAPWALPADCPYSNPMDRFAANYLPTSMVSSMVGSMERIMLQCFSRKTLVHKLVEKSSLNEQECFQKRYNTISSESSLPSSKRDFVKELDWIMDSVEPQPLDVSVCLSPSKVLGIDYEIIQQTQSKMVICQGDRDHMAPKAATEWFANKLNMTTNSNENNNKKNKNKIFGDNGKKQNNNENSTPPPLSLPMSLNFVPNGTHMGALFLLGSQFVEALQILKQ